MRRIAVSLALANLALLGCQPRQVASDLRGEDMLSDNVLDEKLLVTCTNFINENKIEFPDGTLLISFSPERSRLSMAQQEAKTGLKQKLVYLKIVGSIGLGGEVSPFTNKPSFDLYTFKWSLEQPPLVKKVETHADGFQFQMFDGTCKDGYCSNVLVFKSDGGEFKNSQDITSLQIGTETVFKATRFQGGPSTYKFSKCTVNKNYLTALQKALN